MIIDDTLIFDLENATHGEKPDPNKDELRLFSCYSYKTKKYYHLYNLESIKIILNHHKYIVGFNIKQYDNTVLNRYIPGYFNSNNYGDTHFKNKYTIDLLNIVKLRNNLILTNNGLLSDLLIDYKLDTIVKNLGLADNNTGKKELEYDKLNPEVSNWSDDVKQEIEGYAEHDVLLTKKLYEWLESFFDRFKNYVHHQDVINKKYLTSTPAVFVYKAICKRLGWDEEYQNIDGGSYGGGYVAYPAGEEFNGNIYCLDFNSLYPHCFIQGNLFSPSMNGWSGGKKFKTKGVYNSEELGAVERLLKEFYDERVEFKKNGNPMEYTNKIIINTSYGLTGNPSFKHLYNETAASDCTNLGRQFTTYARKIFREEGYINIYSDTDSVYILDVYNNKNKLLGVKNRIVDNIKSSMNFPQSTFDMGIDDEITHMFFFKGRNKKEDDLFMDEDDYNNKRLNLMKKNYIYIAKIFNKNGDWIDDKIVYKNLGVKKKSTSLLTRKIFREHIIPRIKNEKKVKFQKKWFEQLIVKLVKEDIGVVATRYNVDKPENYKSNTSIQYQISTKYGSGVHYLIDNYKLGAGKSKKKCSIAEFKANNLRINDINLDGVWSELIYFIEEEQKTTLKNWGI